MPIITVPFFCPPFFCPHSRSREPGPNNADAPNAAIALRFYFENHWRDVGDLRRSATSHAMRVQSTILVSVLAFLFSCAAVHSAPPRNEAEAGVIVTNLVRKMGGKLESFQQPKVTFSESPRQWSFFYTLKPPGMPGGHFRVIVDEAGKTTYRGGK
jgi:hypothetical protein